MYNICKLVIKYFKFTSILDGENSILNKTDIDTLKYGYQIGLDTLLVHTINYEYLDYISKLTLKYSAWAV